MKDIIKSDKDLSSSVKNEIKLPADIQLTDEEIAKKFYETLKETVLKKIPVIKNIIEFSIDFANQLNQKKQEKFNENIKKAIDENRIKIEQLVEFLKGEKGNAFFINLLRNLIFEGDSAKLELFSKLFIHIIDQGNIDELFEEKMIFLGVLSRISYSEFQLLINFEEYPEIETNVVPMSINSVPQEAIEPFIKKIGIENVELWKIKSMFHTLINEQLITIKKVGEKNKSIWKYIYTIKGEKFIDHIKISNIIGIQFLL